jgi:hypothetical protein
MKITDYYCDRCGKPMAYTYIAFVKTYRGIKIRKDYDYEFGVSGMELCPDCFDSFKEWWSKGKEIEE